MYNLALKMAAMPVHLAQAGRLTQQWHPYINSALRVNIRANDPTATKVLRGQFVSQMNKRFRQLKGDINRTIIDNNYFGGEPNRIIVMAPLERQFTYTYTHDKINGFMEWLKKQEEAGILETITQPGFGRGPSQLPWTNTYIQSAYQKGIGFAGQQLRNEMRKSGLPESELPSMFGPIPQLGATRSISAIFNEPMHVDRAGILYTRTFNGLKGITDTMDGQISEVLTRGIMEGRNPRELARVINDRVDKVGITRARLLARTEITHAHQAASLNEYALAETVIGKKVLVQWFTAEDDRVRAEHRARHEQIYTQEEAAALIGEPNCRCAVLPYVEAWHKEEPKPPEPELPTDTGFFKKAEHKLKFDQYSKEFEGMTGKQIRGVLKTKCRAVMEILDEWQGSTQRSSCVALKQIAQKIESKKLQAFYRTDITGTAIEHQIKMYGEEVLIDQYLRVRAATQEYYKKIKRKKITLFRGTDGNKSGPQFKDQCIKATEDAKKRGWHPDNVKVTIKENALVGYTDDPIIAKNFGFSSGGVTIKLGVPVEDIFIPHEIWPKMGHIGEKEFIVLGSPETKVTLKNCNYEPQVWRLDPKFKKIW